MKALILAGDGINCEQETAQAFGLVGFQPVIRHMNDMINEQMSLDHLKAQYRVLAIPGGFSFGDDLGSGRVLALKLQYALKWDLLEFAKRGGLVIGICNGFQALLRMGVFSKQVSITQNLRGSFINTWVKLVPTAKKNIWLKGIGEFSLPIRHGEGRVIFPKTNRAEAIEKLERSGMLSLRYVQNPNGSEENIAGLSDPSGRIFGLMPHPEAFVRQTAHPTWTEDRDGAGSVGEGIHLFENAYYEAKNST